MSAGPSSGAATPADVARAALAAKQRIHLPNDALIMRGGTLRLEDLEKTVKVAMVRLGRPGISVFGADVDSPASLLKLVSARVPHPQVRFTTAGRLRELGFELEQTGEPPHHTVWLPEEDDSGNFWLRQFRSAFEPPELREDLADYRPDAFQ